MSNVIEPKVGVTYNVSFPKKYPKYSFKILIVSTTLEDPQGSIQYQMLEKRFDDITQFCTDVTSIVEPAWFDEDLTGRRVEKL